MSLQVDYHEGMVDDDVFGTIVDVVWHLLIQCRNGRTMIGMLWWWWLAATAAAAAAPPPYGVEIMTDDALDVERVSTFYYIFVSVSIIIILCILLYY